MRRAFHNRGFLGENEQFYGVSLGYDFTSEHEWGIKRMTRKFGMKTDKLGIKGRTMTEGEVLFLETDKVCLLTSRIPYQEKEVYTLDDLWPHDISKELDDLQTAWNEEDFCIVTNNKDDFQHMRDLYVAFQNKNIVITFISSKLPAFENASLSVLIKDTLPKTIVDMMMNSDLKSKRLLEYEEKIGVRKLKDEAKKKSSYQSENYYMACSPKWIDYEDEVEREKGKKAMGTEFDIIFWINYSDDDNNYGWYTGEQIIKWLSTPGLKLKSLNKKEDD